MASINISIRKEVYEWLRAQRWPGESFSDAILRLSRENAEQDSQPPMPSD